MKMASIIFQKKFCLGQIDHFGPIFNSGSDVRVFLSFAQSKGLIGR